MTSNSWEARDCATGRSIPCVTLFSNHPASLSAPQDHQNKPRCARLYFCKARCHSPVSAFRLSLPRRTGSTQPSFHQGVRQCRSAGQECEEPALGIDSIALVLRIKRLILFSFRDSLWHMIEREPSVCILRSAVASLILQPSRVNPLQEGFPSFKTRIDSAIAGYIRCTVQRLALVGVFRVCSGRVPFARHYDHAER